MPDVSIVNSTVTSAPTDYTVPGTQELLLKAVRASIDGSGAATPFLPALQLLDPAGHVMWTAVDTSTTVAAGGSADVSWFPDVSRSGGTSSSTTQAIMVGRTNIGSTTTVNAGTSARISFDTLQTSNSSVFDVGAGSGTSWKAKVAGTYQVFFWATPNGFWPAAGSAPVDMHLNTLSELFFELSSLIDPDGSALTVGWFGFCVADAGVPERISVSLHNNTGTNFTTVGPDTKVLCVYAGPDVSV